MPVFGGRDTHGKIIMVHPEDDEGDDTLLSLTDRQRDLCLSMSEYLDWGSRWEYFPPDLTDRDARDAYVSDLKDRLMKVIEFCSEVINCIQTDEETQNAINQFMINSMLNNVAVQDALRQAMQSALGRENRSGNSNTNLNLTGLCDDGKLANASIELTAWLHQNNIDWLEKVSQAATPATRSQVLTENLPDFATGVLGEAISEVFTFFSAAFKTNYEATVDNAYLDRLRYDIWCMARNDCELTIDDLYRLMYKRLNYHPTLLDSFASGFIFAFTGEWTGANIADVMMFVQVGAFKFLSGFLSYRNATPLSNMITEGFDDTDDAWETWLETFGECPNCAAPFEVTKGSLRE